MTNTKETLSNQSWKASDAKAALTNNDPGPRIPEKLGEMFDRETSWLYAKGCSYKETSDYAITAEEIAETLRKAGQTLHGTFVEVGSGPGLLEKELLERGVDHMIGIDGSPDMIEFAKGKFPQEIAEGKMEFRQAEAQHLPLPDNFVDGIVSFNSFHQFETMERVFQAFSEMARVLKPGGWGIVRDFRRDIEDKEKVLKNWFEQRETIDEIKPLLGASIPAATTKDESRKMLEQIQGIEFEVIDAPDPRRLPGLKEIIANDPVAHWSDHLVSQVVIFRKK